MSDRPSHPSSTHLEPPRKSVELEDPGAQESASGSEDDHFSDASEGRPRSPSQGASGRTSPVPRTRVEKVDDNPSYGEVPGLAAYEKREQDAVPDEIEIIPDGAPSRRASTAGLEPPSTPGGTPVPRTLVEKVDPSAPSYGEVPGTEAYEMRKADATPDRILKMSESGERPPSFDLEPQEHSSPSGPIPETRLSHVDSFPNDSASPGPRAHTRHPSDAEPDSIEEVQDPPGKSGFSLAHQASGGRLTNSDSPTSPSDRAAHRSHTRRKDPLAPDTDTCGNADDRADSDGIDKSEETHNDGDDDEASVNDFDDFEEGAEGAGDDDFGDFDDGFQVPTVEAAGDHAMDQTSLTPQQPPIVPSVLPLLDFDSFKSLPDLLAATDDHLDALFPTTTKELSSLPPIETIPDPSAIFTNERSLSLWSQLVAPPPLQPPNWVKSRIRRLFLVSLGVPVDLDEILPASKQKKLILPSINPDGSASSNPSDPSRPDNKPGKKDDPQSNNGSSTSASRQKSSSSRRRGPPPPPELDLTAVRRLCATTDAALDGLTDAELKAHVRELQDATGRASQVLEYWLKLRDGLVSEKEAFEGVIENLVSHARRVRK